MGSGHKRAEVWSNLTEVKLFTFDAGILARLQTIFKSFICEIASQKKGNSCQNENRCIKSGAV